MNEQIKTELEVPKRENWYFTFCQSDEKRNGYAKFYGTVGESRQQMVDIWGTYWAFQYSEKDFEGQVEAYGLYEVK